MQLDSVLIHRAIVGNSIKSLLLATHQMSKIAEPGSYAAGVIDGRLQVLSEVAVVIGCDLPELPITLAND